MIYLLVFRCFSRLMLGFIAAGFDTIVVLNYVNSMAGISSKHLLRLQMAFMPTIWRAADIDGLQTLRGGAAGDIDEI